jgi:A/G-specific adenine glycosylase
MDATELLLKWYDANKRDLPWRRTHEPYAVLVSEMMLQQTRVGTVISYYEEFMRRFPDVFALARAAEIEVLGAWKGLGYYSRARNLHRCAQQIAERCGGKFPDTREGWLALPGVGDYIAGAVMSIALGRPCPAVDGNVLRVISRLYGLRGDIAAPAVRKEVEARVKGMMPQDRASDFAQALMELGALVCKPASPECGSCPVAVHCKALAQDAVQQIPVRTPRKAPREIKLAVAAVVCGGFLLMERRGEKALLAGMYGLPAVELEERRAPEALFRERYALELQVGVSVGHARHTFTHQRWEMDVRYYETDKPFPAGERLEWVPAESIDEKPVPKAFQKAIEVFREYYARGDHDE